MTTDELELAIRKELNELMLMTIKMVVRDGGPLALISHFMYPAYADTPGIGVTHIST